VGWPMKGLVLLSDEVALLKFAATQGALRRTGETLGHEIACDFFCQSGLADLEGDQVRLTAFGQRLARRLISTSAAGTVSIPPALLDALGPQVVFTRSPCM